MALELDHAFICCSTGAPEGDTLVRLGLTEGTPNTHPGQGTANRRFFFRNAFLELLWVCDPAEVRSGQTSRTRLWERWSGRVSGACPFGLVFRPESGTDPRAPFRTWAYTPDYLPPGAVIEFAEGVPLEEPELVYLPFVHRSGPPAREPINHSLPIRDVCGLMVGLPSSGKLSESSRAARSADLVNYRLARDPVLELAFVDGRETVYDLRPVLPLVFRGVACDPV
jgi:hypothetical protein